SNDDPGGYADNDPQVQGERAEAAKRIPATNQRKRNQPCQSVCQPGNPSQARRRKPPSWARAKTNCWMVSCGSGTPSCGALTAASSGSTPRVAGCSGKAHTDIGGRTMVMFPASNCIALTAVSLTRSGFWNV